MTPKIMRAILKRRISNQPSCWFGVGLLIAGCGADVNPAQSGASGGSSAVTAVGGGSSTVSGALPVEVAVGSGAFACARLSDGTARCWGADLWDNLGYDSSLLPVKVEGVTQVYMVPWAANPVPVQELTNASQLSLGVDHACALLEDRTVKCWGNNQTGQLGVGDQITQSFLPQPVVGLSDVVSLSAGDAYTCAVLADGTAKCWGYNGHGVLGNGTSSNSAMPVAVQGVFDVSQITVKRNSTCALLADGHVKCWGANSHGQLGDGTTEDSLSPVTVTQLSGALEVHSGDDFSCARLTDGSVRCWGNNLDGALGNGTTDPSSTPVTVQGLTGVRALSVGDWTSCALTSSSQVKCWGSNSNSALGDGSAVFSSTTPVTVGGDLAEVEQLASGAGTSCALVSTDVMCWGANYYGQVGDGTTVDRFNPTLVLNLP